MFNVDYTYNGRAVSASVATHPEALSLSDAIFSAYGVWADITSSVVPSASGFTPGDRIRVTAWLGEWQVISIDGPTLWLRPWQGMGEPKGAPVSLCECV
jgi:hypothetical protein